MLAKTPAYRAIMLAAALALCACQSAGIDDLAPAAAFNAPLPPAEAGTPLPSAAPRAQTRTAAAPDPAPGFDASAESKNTGEFPKIGHIPTGETAQLGDGGAAALRSELSAARASQNANAGAPETYVEKLRRLRLLQAKHASETLAEIEARKPQ
jgi:hypothetical protein